jgi:hypothetical protein
MLLTLALLSLLVMYLLGPGGHVAGTASRIMILLELGACLVAAWSCTLAGAITGWVGVCRSPMGLAWSSLLINSALCIAGIPLWATLLFKMGFFDGL